MLSASPSSARCCTALSMRCGFGACSGQYGEILNASFELSLYRIEYVAETEAVYLFLCLTEPLKWYALSTKDPTASGGERSIVGNT